MQKLMIIFYIVTMIFLMCCMGWFTLYSKYIVDLSIYNSKHSYRLTIDSNRPIELVNHEGN